jgi:class 3 adenylate cyclase
MDFKVDDAQLEESLAKVERARNWSPRVISKLENAIRTAGDDDLFRVSPLQWAAEKNMAEHEAIDLFLFGAKAGLFYMEWNVICPCCAQITQSLRDLHSVEAESTCKLCFRKDQPNLDDAVQISFTLSPSVRELRFHHPETLSLEDYCFKYLFEPSTTVVSGLLPFKDAFEYGKRHFSAFAPGEKITVETEVGVGALASWDLFGQRSFGLVASGELAPETQRIAVKLTDHGFEVPLPEMRPGEFSAGGADFAGTFYPIRPGKVILEFEHSASTRAALLVAFYPIPVGDTGTFILPPGLPPALEPFISAVVGGNTEVPIPAGLPPEMVSMIEGVLAKIKAGGGFTMQMQPFHQYATPRLTAKRLFASQTFHDLFRAEVFQEAEGFGVKDVTILFTDLKSSTHLYQQIGDLNAYALVREHYGVLNTAILNQHGAIVKTIGDAIMANFNQPVEAVGSALEMLRELRRLNQSSQRGTLVLKIGIHRGAAIAVTLNNRIDYFGQTVNIASRVQGSAGGDEIYLTDQIYTAAGVRELLQALHCQAEPVEIQLRGVEEQVKVYRVTSPA